MKTRPFGWLGVLLGVLGLCAALASSACSDDNDGDPAASLASCDTYCERHIAAMCAVPFHADVEACKSLECATIPVQPPQCQTKIKARYDCMQAQADLCVDEGCDVETDALFRCQ